ncbi:polysaccharide biosynthesis protein [Bacillus sp. MUM 116]|nr:polysaccharide biosynthesis protein [Bacillus sp. MUM 116]
MNIFIKKLLGFSIGPVAGAFITFITIPITTYFISPSEFGKASMFTLFQVLIVGFLYLGLDQSYTREYHEVDKKDNLLKNALLFPLILSIIIFVIICTNSNKVSMLLFESEKYKIAAKLFGLTIVTLTIERFILLSIRMKENAFEYSVINIVIRLNILVFTLIFVMFIRKDFLAVVYSTALGQLIGDIYLIIHYNKLLNFMKFKFDKSLILKLLKFGVPLIIAASVNNLLNSLDRLALRMWSDFSNIGIFTAALKVSSTLSIIQVSFTSFWVPTAYRWYSQDKDVKHFEIVSNVILLLMSILFCLILLFKDFIVILLSPDYIGSKFIIGFLCLQPIMYTVSETTTLGIVFSKRSYLNLFVSLISIIPNIVLNLLLVPRYGAIGASIATGISYIFFFFGRSYFSNKHWTGFPLRRHILVTLTIFLGALVNSTSNKYINLINLFLLSLTILIQIPTIKKIILLNNNKSKKEWDFS